MNYPDMIESLMSENKQLQQRIAELEHKLIELENWRRESTPISELIARDKRIWELEEFVRECAKYRVAWAEKLLGS